jgi:hypothetical protein
MTGPGRSARSGSDARSTAQVLGAVTLFGLAIRLAMLETLPLLVTADSLVYPEGRGYLVWAREIAAQGDLAGPAFRTPGYPLLLAGAFALAGVRDQAVLGLQHLAGLATVALITWVAARRAGPRVALVTGGLAALDPWHLLFAHYALSESATVLFVVASAAAVLLPSSHSLAQGLGVGLLAGAACLVRPACQMLIPFLGAAYLLSAPRRRPRLAGACVALGLGLVLSLGPWLAFNATRGVRGLAAPSEGVLFTALLFHRLLDARDIPADAPEAVRSVFSASEAEQAEPRFSDRLSRAAAESGLGSAQREAWARASFVRNLSRYPSAACDTFRTLLDVGAPNRPPVPDERLSFILHLTSEPRGATLQQHRLPGALPTPPPVMPAALAALVHEGFARAFDLASWLRGVPQVPLALLACVALALCLRARRYPEAAFLAGSLAFVAGHALILYPHQRFTLPAQMLWYLALPLLHQALATSRASQARGRSPAPSSS